MTSDTRFSLTGFIVGALAALLVIIGTFNAESFARKLHLDQIHLSAVEFSNSIFEILFYEINSRVLATESLRTVLAAHNYKLSHEDFNRYAGTIIHTGASGIRSLQLAKGGVIDMVYPIKGNEAVLGLNILEHHAQGGKAREFLEKRQLMVDGPINLIQGGKGIVARLPVFLDAGRGEFWGFSTVVMEIRPILEGISRRLSGSGFVVAIRPANADGSWGKAFFGDEEVFGEKAQASTFRMSGSEWQVGIMPYGGWPASSPQSGLIYMTGILTAIVSAVGVYLLVVTNIRLRVARIEAESASAAKSAFLANMSHELRTPLNCIIGFSETMNREIFGPINNEKYISYLRDINSSGVLLLELVNDILDISAIEAGAVNLVEEEVDTWKVACDCAHSLKGRAEQAGVTLSCDAGRSVPKLLVDERRFRQVLLNLLSNAIKFTPSGGKVSLASRPGIDGSLIILVSDTGIGMDKDDIAIALSSFGQVDSKISRKYEGTGLGLPLTRGLMELHGGRLEITSRKNRGTDVMLIFPPQRVLR